MSDEDRATKATLYELLGISRERADEIARMVRASFSQSKSPSEWIAGLAEEFQIKEGEMAEVFACGWFAGKYAGASEVFQTVQKEIDRRELDLAEKKEKQSRHPPPDGYA
jgi:hypothetical protein